MKILIAEYNQIFQTSRWSAFLFLYEKIGDDFYFQTCLLVKEPCDILDCISKLRG